MDELTERVAKAIMDAMDITDGLDGTAAKAYAEAAINEIIKNASSCGVCGCAVYKGLPAAVSHT